MHENVTVKKRAASGVAHNEATFHRQQSEGHTAAGNSRPGASKQRACARVHESKHHGKRVLPTENPRVCVGGRDYWKSIHIGTHPTSRPALNDVFFVFHINIEYNIRPPRLL